MNTIRLPSERIIELKELTGADWKECLYNAKRLSVEKGIDMADIGYWEKYAELSSGLSKQELENMSLEDYQYFIKRLMDSKSAGPKGPRENPEIRKN